jgi:hypothetical protein
MGFYLNPDKGNFVQAINSEIYVDKTGLLIATNKLINTLQKYVCVSRPRRFGKSIAMSMLATYYDSEGDSSEIFSPFEIYKSPDYETHQGKYEVIAIDIQRFLSKAGGNVTEMVRIIRTDLVKELRKKFDAGAGELEEVMEDIYQKQDKSFVVLIDEWDCIFRVKKDATEEQKTYLDFLRSWFKDRSYIAIAYMTGILPIKKYGTHSALNMFDEYSMTDQSVFARFTGFTQSEVAVLCAQYDMQLSEMESWYNGYQLLGRDGTVAIYSPRSVVKALMRGRYAGYWTRTETYDALKIYIEMNYDGLRDTIISLLAGDRQRINTTKYSNDMVTFAGFEDVLTLLIHLGYLGYDEMTEEVFIPNKEIYNEFVNAVEDIRWGGEVAKAIRSSENLLSATWQMDAETVAGLVESAHQETAHLTYNSETALSYTISLAYYAAREYYNIAREYPAGKGFADLIFQPKSNHPNKPAMIVELKWDKDADTAIKQIHEKQYPDAVKDYRDNLLLIGISYDKTTKKHEAVIEKS